MKTVVRTLLAIACAFGTASVRAQQPNMELLFKWSSVAVIHYDVVAEYAGETEILRGPMGFSYSAQVQDRVEVAFDWDQNETKLVGTPVIKNFPTTVAPVTADPGCPPVRVDGAYEHVDVTGAKGLDYNPILELVASRTFPAGAIPLPADTTTACGSLWDESAARSDVEEGIGVLVMPTMYLAMPAAAGAGITVGADGKTITAVQSGWTFTYTLSMKP